MTDKTVSVPQQGVCAHPQTTYMLGNTYCAVCKDWLHAGFHKPASEPISVPTESRPTERIRQIRERLEAATEGDWSSVQGHESDDWGVTEAGTDGKSIAQMCWEWDAKFIAHAKSDIAYLLAALKSASSSLLPVPEKLPNRAEDMEGLIGAVWAAHDEWKRLDARNQLSGESDYAEWLADAVLNHLRAGLPVGRQLIDRMFKYLHHDKSCAHRKDSQAHCDCGLNEVIDAYRLASSPVGESTSPKAK